MNNIFTRDKIIELNKIINYIDIQKDAITPTINIDSINGKILFTYCLNELFRNDGSYGSQLNYIIETVNNFDKGTTNNYNSYDNKYVNFLSPNITHVMYDTGVNPININKNIKIINTPASYIDSADKVKHSEECCFSDVLTADVFNILGINYIKEIKNIDTKNILNTSIIFNLDKKYLLSLRFNKLTNDKEYRPRYFKGNSDKNKWFNENFLKIIINRKEHYNLNIIEQGKLYLLCKLLGDLLQAYYCKLYLDKLPAQKRNSCCIFTVDNILRIRSILLNIPVLYNRVIDNKVLMTIYHTSKPNINTQFQKMYYDNMKSHNFSIIENINNVLNIGHFFIGSQKITINEKIKKALININTYINQKTNIAKNINEPILEIYRKHVCNYMGRHIFHKINTDQTYICYTDIHFLFPGLDNMKDIIGKTGHVLSDIFLSLNPQKGGNREELVEYTIGDDYVFDFVINTDEEYDTKMNTLLLENTGEAVKFSIYYAVSKHDFMSELDKYDAIYNIYNNIFNFYTYSGKTIVSSEFLEKVFMLYNTKQLSKMRPDEFDKVIEDWLLTQPNEEEMEMKKIEEWEKSFNMEELKRAFNEANIQNSPLQEKKRKRNMSVNYTRKSSKLSIFTPLSRQAQNKTKKISKSR